MSNIGERIKERRKLLGITADELAEKTGKGRATIYRYENSDIRNLPITVLEPLAAALDVSPAWLMGYDDAETGGASAAIDIDEAAVLSQYRRLSPQGKQQIRDQLRYRLADEYEENKKETRHA